MSKKRDPQISFAINLYALYETPASAFRAMRNEFGDSCLTAHAIKKIRETHRREILQRRSELTTKIPILDADERWAYLQAIVDGALEGEVVYDKRTNQPIEAKVDRTAALNALKLANDMATSKGTVNTEDDDLIKSIVTEAFDEMKQAHPKMNNSDILDTILSELGEKVAPYVDQMREAYVVVDTQES